MRDSSRPGLALLAASISLSLALSGCSSDPEPADTGDAANAAATDSAQHSLKHPVSTEAGKGAGKGSGKDKTQKTDYVLEIAKRLAKEPWNDDRLDFSLGFEYSVVDLPGEPYSLLFERAFLEEHNGAAKVAVLDPKKKEMVSQYEDYLGLGVASAGGYRGRIHPSADGTQLLYVTTMSGTGATEVQRVSAPGGHVKLSPVAQGRWDKLEHMWGEEIQWQQLPSAANPGRSGRKPRPTLARKNSQSQDGAGPNPVAPTGNSAQPADGSPVRLSGTIRILSTEELLDLQQIDNPNRGSAPEDYIIFILDTPVIFGARRVAKTDLDYQETRMIKLRDSPGAGRYDGQHVTVEFSPYDTWWPSDTGLPLGQPYTSVFRILP